MYNLILLSGLFFSSFIHAAEKIEVGRPYQSNIQPYGTIVYEFVVPEETKYKISLTNAQSDLAWYVADDIDEPTYEYDCDFNVRSRTKQSQDEICDILLKPGTYYLLVDEYSSVSSSFDLIIESIGKLYTIPIKIGIDYEFVGGISDRDLFLLENGSTDFLKATVQRWSEKNQLIIYSSNFTMLKTCDLDNGKGIDCFRLFKKGFYYFQVTGSNQSESPVHLEISRVKKEALSLNNSVNGYLNSGELKIYSTVITEPGFFSFFLDNTTTTSNFSIYNSKYEMISEHACKRFGTNIRCNIQLPSGKYYLRLESYNNLSTRFDLKTQMLTSTTQINLNQKILINLLPFEMQVYDLNLLNSANIDANLFLSSGQYVELSLYDELDNLIAESPIDLHLKAGKYRFIVKNNMPKDVQTTLLVGEK